MRHILGRRSLADGQPTLQLHIKLALHPNDPPVDAIGGIPCLIRNVAAYERVFDMGGQSSALGMEFCCGCWLEGGDRFGDIYTCLPDFVKRGKVRCKCDCAGECREGSKAADNVSPIDATGAVCQRTKRLMCGFPHRLVTERRCSFIKLGPQLYHSHTCAKIRCVAIRWQCK